MHNKRGKREINKKRNGNWYEKRLCLSWKSMVFDLSLDLYVVEQLFYSTLLKYGGHQNDNDIE